MQRNWRTLTSFLKCFLLLFGSLNLPVLAEQSATAGVADHSAMASGHSTADPAAHQAMASGHDMASGHGAEHAPDFSKFNRDKAYQYSQAAIGKKIADYQFTDSQGNKVSLKDFDGHPLLISMIYTSCYHICPTTTKNLAGVVKMAQQAMPDKRFISLTVGFDTQVDTPEAMRNFARQQGGDKLKDWYFLSVDQASVTALAKDLGFIYYPSPQGFDHLVQTTLVDADRVVRRQVYGMKFDMQLLIEPLKGLLYNRPTESLAQAMSDKIRFFCTVYDPAQDRYHFDYSIFIGVFIGIMSCLILGVQLFKEWRKALKRS